MQINGTLCRIKSFNLSNQMDIHDYHAVEHELKKNDVCCIVVEGSTLKETKASLNLDYSLHHIISKLKRAYNQLPHQEDGGADDLLEKLPKLSLRFYKCKAITFTTTLLGPNVFSITPEHLDKDFTQILETPLDVGVFLPLVVSKNIFHHHETAEKNPSLANFWNYPLEKQLFTLQSISDAKARSVLVLSTIAKTNSNCYGSVQVNGFKTKEYGYCFYKINNHVLILFGLSGPKEYVSECLDGIIKAIVTHAVILVQAQRDIEIPYFKSWKTQLIEGGWKVFSVYDEYVKMKRTLIGTKVTMQPIKDSIDKTQDTLLDNKQSNTKDIDPQLVLNGDARKLGDNKQTNTRDMDPQLVVNEVVRKLGDLAALEIKVVENQERILDKQKELCRRQKETTKTLREYIDDLEVEDDDGNANGKSSVNPDLVPNQKGNEVAIDMY